MSHPDPDICLGFTRDVTKYQYLNIPQLRDMANHNSRIESHNNFSYTLWLHLTSSLDYLRTLIRDQVIRSSSFTNLDIYSSAF
ncbi:hypothetical protein FF1_007074 [Malus domestica]